MRGVTFGATRRCNACNAEYPNTTEFFSRNGRYLRSYCKGCSQKKARVWQATNREQHRRSTNAWRKANRARVSQTNSAWHARNPARSKQISRETYLRRKYGMTPTDVVGLVESQQGVCANPGCDAAISDTGIGSHIDHDHSTGAIRGILCSKCNQALGLLKEDTSRILGLSQYLECARAL